MRRRLPSRIFLAGLCSVILGVAAVTAAAQTGAQVSGTQKADPDSRLKQLERELRQGETESQRLKRRAATLDAELKALSQRLVSQAQAVQDRELRVITLEALLADLLRQEREKSKELAANRAQFSRVLVALQRLARFPPEALLAHSGSPDKMVRSAILLRSVVPEIELRATRLKIDLQALADTRRETARQRLNLASANDDLDHQRKEIKALAAEKRRLLRSTLAERKKAARRVARLASEAKDLRHLLMTLEDARRKREAAAKRAAEQAAQRARAAIRQAKKRVAEGQRAQQAAKAATISPPPPTTPRPIAKARGQLPFPAVGRVVRRYGEATSEGFARKGVDIQTRAGAQVISTYDGRVAYSGKFRGYGELLIIEHPGGYHTLLAGMARIDAEVGHQVTAGEPIGVMGNATSGKPILYLELRRQGQPINPLPWLAAVKNRVSG